MKNRKPKIISQKALDGLTKNHNTEVIDAFSFQLRELYSIKYPENLIIPKKDRFLSKSFLSFVKEYEKKCVLIYFPWSNKVIRNVGEEDFFILRTNRNQDLITPQEQTLLYNKKIAVFGMSVGSNIALLLGQAGISKNITIADFDEVDTTNLNRVLAGVQDIGTNKAILIAQKLYEANPFAKVRCMDDGVDLVSLESLLQKKQIDLIIEEVDDFEFKIKSRVLAIKYKIPVLMVTDNGDGVVLHVERYDLGLESIFNKQLDYWMSKFDGQKPTLQQMSELIIDDIVGGKDNVDPKMLDSVDKVINHELASWPQLGSAAMLAGVVATVFTKKVLLGENVQPDIRQTIFIPSLNLTTHND